MTEELMLAGCLNNDSNSQEALYNRFSPRMLGVCYRFAKSREDAEDMLQEGFIKILSLWRGAVHHFFDGCILRVNLSLEYLCLLWL